MDPVIIGVIVLTICVCIVSSIIGALLISRRNATTTTPYTTLATAFATAAPVATAPTAVKVVVTPFAEDKKSGGAFRLPADGMDTEPAANPKWRYKNNSKWSDKKCLKNWSLMDSEGNPLIGNVTEYTGYASKDGKPWCALKIDDENRYKFKRGGVNSIRNRPDDGNLIKNPSGTRLDDCLENWNYYDKDGDLVYGNVSKVLKEGTDTTKWWCPKTKAPQYKKAPKA